MDNKEKQEITEFAGRIRLEIVKMISGLPAGHLGGAMSAADLYALLYTKHLRYDPKNPKWEDRDWVVLSKGHAGPAMYATLALKGFFPMEQLATINTPHTDLPSHTDRNHTPGVDMTTGSLGQGASTAAGVAYGIKLDKKDNYVYVIFGDGECQEGQIWEMAMFAKTKHLDNLIAFVDFNKLQIDGRTDCDDVCNMTDLPEMWKGFGWYVQRVNGHDVEALDAAICSAKANKGTPSVIIMDTVKGKGWSKAENQVGSHSRGLTAEELAEATAEIKAAYGI